MKLLTSLFCLLSLLKTFLAELVVPELRSNHVKVYQSANQQSIDLVGSNFKTGISFTFEPVLKIEEDYTLVIVDSNHAKLNLAKGKKWRSEAGSIVAKTVTVEDNVVVLGDDGIVVAWVLTDPEIFTSITATFYESQTHVLRIFGRGFTAINDMELNMNPTPSSSYKILGVLDSMLILQLTSYSWLPSHLSLKNQNDKVALTVSSINTGAGVISFAPPISLGFIIPDIKGVECNDSCEFAIDGVCDDGSVVTNNSYADAEEDDYYQPNDNIRTPACALNTDCTDCGGVDAMLLRDRSISL